MNRDEILAIVFSFVSYESGMKERYSKYHKDYGKYLTDDMFTFNKFDRITEIKAEPADKLRKQFSGKCFDLAYCACEYLRTKENVRCAMVIPVKRRRINSPSDLVWNAYSDCGESKEWYWHAVTVFRTRNERCYVLDITHCNKVYEFKKWLSLTAEYNKCNVKDFRYDKNMFVAGNVALGLNGKEVHEMLTLCDSLLGKPQCNIFTNSDGVDIEGDDISVDGDLTSQDITAIRIASDAISSIRIKALGNSRIESQLRSSYYSRNNIHPSKVNSFNNDELVMQDIEMYCSPEDVMYAGLSCSLMGAI